jgi:hypothetical protein
MLSYSEAEDGEDELDDPERSSISLWKVIVESPCKKSL